ncbi:hypothetical protein A9Q81_11805 [Gammaproteobacteria bacterium 42_54_T18]|nr:hypothetical protein A9Q81_11805 [Gammaproteobacteria bacterium 42_54_T18]
MNKVHLSQWWDLTDEEKQDIVSDVVRPHEGVWYAGFSSMLKANLHLLDNYLKKTEEERLSGVACVGSKYIVEEMRREGLKDTRDKRLFNINNNYTADMARLAMLLFPVELKGFFRVRTLKRGFRA